MHDSADRADDPAADDPDIAALLAFPPVIRRNKRHDGWGPAEQKGFIAWLAATGNVDKAAQAVGRTQSGAWGVRNALGGDGFSEAWEAALDLFHGRRRAQKLDELAAPPAGPRHTPRRVREAREAKAFRRGASRGRGAAIPAEDEPPELDEAEKLELLEEIFKRYLIKLEGERTARLDGRIVEADFYVRQLTHIELILDVGGRVQELLDGLSWDGLHLVQVSATPGSAYMEKLRRAYWLEKGEADRPPPAPLGDHNERFSTGADAYDPERDGDFKTWERRQQEKQRLAAEAQREWEDRARAEAAARQPGPGAPDDASGDSGP